MDPWFVPYVLPASTLQVSELSSKIAKLTSQLEATSTKLTSDTGEQRGDLGNCTMSSLRGALVGALQQRIGVEARHGPPATAIKTAIVSSVTVSSPCPASVLSCPAAAFTASIEALKKQVASLEAEKAAAVARIAELEATIAVVSGPVMWWGRW